MRLSLAEQTRPQTKVSDQVRPLAKASEKTQQPAKVSERTRPPAKVLEQSRLLEKVPEQIRETRAQEHSSDWFQRGIAAHEERQYVKALAAWRQAAAQGSVEAQYRIGLLYMRGEGVVQSIPDAIAWHEPAAKAGHVEAQFQLGSIYLNGTKHRPTVPHH